MGQSARSDRRLKDRSRQRCSRRGLVLLALLALLLLSAPLALAEEAVTEEALSAENYSLALAERALDAGGDSREAMLEEALSYSPDLPGLYFKMARAKLPNVVTSLSYIVKGISAYGQNFWWFASLQGLLYVSLLLSFCASLLLVVIMRLWADLPLLVHDINETKPKLLVPLILVPLALMGPMALLAGLLVLVGLYMRKVDKWAVYLYIVVLLAAPVSLGRLDMYFSASSPEMKALVAVNSGKEGKAALRLLSGREDFPSLFSYALALKREGSPAEAIEVYKALQKRYPDWRVYTNMGNAYFRLGLREEAKASYEKAAGMKRTAITIYNMSQVYRDELDFAHGDKLYDEAYGMDRASVTRFNALSEKSGTRLLIDETLSQGELWDFVGSNTRKMLPLHLGPSLWMSGVALVLLLVFIALESVVKSKSYRCTRCNNVACLMCSDPRQWNQMCADCQSAAAADEEAGARARVARMLRASEEKARMVDFIRILSFTLPGLAHIYSGRITQGMAFLWPFFFGLCLLLLNPLFSTGLAGYSHAWTYLIAVPVLVLLYYLSVATVARRLDRGWL